MQYEWVEDGHRVTIGWHGDSLVVDKIECPFDGSNAYCNRRRDSCVVQRFLGVFGAECNVGTCRVDGPVEIAWIGIPGDSDLDNEFSGIWVTPITDSDYISYKDSSAIEDSEE
jgi:hypothetical protein